VRWGQASPAIDIKATADRVYRTDIYRAAAAEMGVACPELDRLPPGAHGEPPMPDVERSPDEVRTRLRSGE
jgi:two-component system, oxyanion-binding sensor